MTEQTTSVLSSFAVRTIEQAYTHKVTAYLQKYVWADKLFDSKGNRKFSIIFAEGKDLEFVVEITTYVKVIMRGINVLPGGQATLTDPETFYSTISILKRAAKHVQSTELAPYRVTLFPDKKVTSDHELTEQIGAIPKEEAEIVSFSYVVRDITNGNTIEIHSDSREPSGGTLFNARVKLFGMRREDD